VIIFLKVVILIMLFVVVARAMGPVVVLFVSIYTTTLVMPSGMLAPPYHLNQSFYCDYFYQSGGTNYTFRGGASSGGFYCGVFYVGLHRSSGYASWSIGAALSFKPWYYL